MFRKSERARKEWKRESPASCAGRQLSILELAAQMVKPGGNLAYTTCTFSPEENEGVVARFLDNHPEFELKKIELAPGFSPPQPQWISLPKGDRIQNAIRIWPHHSPGEGHFIAILIKKTSTNKKPPSGKTTHELSPSRKINTKDHLQAKALLDEFNELNLAFSFENARIALDGKYVYSLPKVTSTLIGLNVVHSGWWLGSIQKERFIPSHALAMAIRADQARHTIPFHLGDQDLSSYLRGESFYDIGENEWVLITLEDFPIGWGKRVKNVVKNYYPHGLRRPF
jgi:NOL1/NOP2/fmu family ribosome biogenesis protein